MTIRLLSSSVVALVTATGAHAVTVTAEGDASVLANNILGSGVVITSATLTGTTTTSTGTFNGSTGVFTDGSSSIGIDEGIILTTGTAKDAEGPNSQDGTTTDLGNPGFAELDALIPDFTTYDGVKLDITFTTDTGNVFFEYVFASEEYNEYVGSSFNDVFGLFLNGSNIAIVPGTTNTPVAINTVNCGDPYDSTGLTGSNCGLFNNNDLDDGGPFFDIEYDGFTDVFTATGTGLAILDADDNPVVHTLSFAIADAGDQVLDSAIFIKGGSLSSEPPPTSVIPVPASFPLLLAGLAGLGFLRRRGARR